MAVRGCLHPYSSAVNGTGAACGRRFNAVIIERASHLAPRRTHMAAIFRIRFVV